MPEPTLKRNTLLAGLRPSLTLMASGLVLLLSGAIFGLVTPAAAQSGSEATPLPLFALPDGRTTPVSSNTLALTRDNRTLVITNILSNSISIVRPVQELLQAEIRVGRDPRTVALTADDTLALVANRGDATLSIVDLELQAVVDTIALGGLWPYAVVAPNNQTAYVSLQGSAEVVRVDLTTNRVVDRIAVPDFPTGLTAWGDFLYVTHFWSGQISLIYLPQRRVIATVSTGADTGLSQSIELDSRRGIAYMPQTRSNAGNPNLTFDSTVFPVVNIMNLRDLSLDRANRISLDTSDRPLNMPFAAVLDPFRQWLFIVNAGSDSVSVIDLNTGLARAHIEVGANPRGLLLNRDNSLLFVHNVIDGTLSIIETRTLQVSDELPITTLTIEADILLGAQLFNAANDPRLSAGNNLSCANCHFDGLSDGRVWQLTPGQPRNTPLLYSLLETTPYTWTGEWDELADVELKVRDFQAGTGLIDALTTPNPALGSTHSGLSFDMDTLVIYLNALEGSPNPYPFDPAVLQRGAEVFAAQECESCHVGQVGTDLQRYDVGTGLEVDTPSLRWLWLSAPYFHDGRAASLTDVFTMPGAHQLIFDVSPEDLDALIQYLLSLPQS